MTLEELRKKHEANFERLDQSLEQGDSDPLQSVATATGIPRPQLREEMCEVAIDDARAAGSINTGLSIGGGILFMAISIILPLAIYFKVNGQYAEQAQAVVVRANTGLAVYQQIGPNDVGLEKGAASPNAFRDTKEVVGRFATRAYKKGELIENGSISKGGPGLEWSGLQTIGVQVKPFAKADFTVFPQKVTLLGTPKPNIKLMKFSLKAILLAADDAKEAWVRLALNPRDLDVLQAALSQFDLYLVQALP